MVVNGSIRLLVQYLAGPDAETLSGLDFISILCAVLYCVAGATSDLLPPLSEPKDHLRMKEGKNEMYYSFSSSCNSKPSAVAGIDSSLEEGSLSDSRFL